MFPKEDELIRIEFVPTVSGAFLTPSACLHITDDEQFGRLFKNSKHALHPVWRADKELCKKLDAIGTGLRNVPSPEEHLSALLELVTQSIENQNQNLNDSSETAAAAATGSSSSGAVAGSSNLNNRASMAAGGGGGSSSSSSRLGLTGPGSESRPEIPSLDVMVKLYGGIDASSGIPKLKPDLPWIWTPSGFRAASGISIFHKGLEPYLFYLEENLRSLSVFEKGIMVRTSHSEMQYLIDRVLHKLPKHDLNKDQILVTRTALEAIYTQVPTKRGQKKDATSLAKLLDESGCTNKIILLPTSKWISLFL